jgi:serine/threonine-protein kinase
MAVVDSAGAGLGLKERDQAASVPLSGAEGGFSPTFSPDGAWIAFFADRALKKVPRRGGAAITLADSTAIGNQSAAWLEDGTLVFNGAGWSLASVSEDGGEVDVFLRPQEAGGFVTRITPLPEGRGVLYLSCNNQCPDHNIHVFDRETREQRLLIEDAVSAWYAPTGHLLYARQDGGVFAAPFDLGSLQTTGPGVPVLEGVRALPWYAAMQLAGDGTLVYLAGENPEFVGGFAKIVRVDRDGTATPVDEDWATDTYTLALSPDGRLLAFNRRGEDGTSVWVKELPDGPETRLSEDAIQNRRPLWSPDGRQVIWQTALQAAGDQALMQRRFDAGTPVEVFLQKDEAVHQATWSRDGRWLVYRQGAQDSQGGEADLYYREIGSDATDQALLTSPEFDEWAPALSPDAQWLAYLSDQSGIPEVYVRPFPNVEDRLIKISDGGGYEPAWAHSGRELFYRDGDGMLVAAALETEPGFRVLSRDPLFQVVGSYRSAASERRYDVALDDQSFLMIAPVSLGTTEAAASHVILVENWFEELKEILRD